MLQYIYKPEQAGFSSWPSGELRLEGIEVTEDPRAADVFVVPGNIRIFETKPGSGVLDHQKLYRLPYLRGNESRTAFFDVSDNFKTPVNLPILFIRCDVRTWMLPHDVNTLQIAWGVEDFANDVYVVTQTRGRLGVWDLPSENAALEFMAARKAEEPTAAFSSISKLDEALTIPDIGLTSDVSFHGWLSSVARRESSASCIHNGEIRADIATYPNFTGYLPDQNHREYNPAEWVRRRQAMRVSMRRSRLSLCPESIPGVLPYRFFEAMSAGRVPLLVSSEYVLPFADEIDYSAFTLFCERDDAKNADKIALEFVGKTPTEQIIEMGKLAREAWARWCDPRLWPKLHSYAVQKQLQKMGVAV